MIATAEITMPNEKKRNDKTAKIAREVVNKASFVADTLGISLAEYLSELLRPLVERDFQKAVKKSQQED